MPTGINEVIKLNEAEFILNKLLEGGFTLPHDGKCGLVILIRGKAGTGKSTLALQILNRIEKEAGKKRIYCSLEQTQTDIRYKLASMGISQAIQHSRNADQNSGTFCCDNDVFLRSLKDGCGRNLNLTEDTTKKIIEQLEKLRPSLHDDDENVRINDSIDNPHNKLVSIFNRALFSEDQKEGWPIEIYDGTEEKQTNKVKNRVLKASRMLINLLDDEKEHDRSERPIVVMDGLSLLTQDERATLMLQSIADKFRKYCKIGIVVYEPGLDEDSSLDHHADIVIDLNRKEKAPINYLIHEMTIRKTRYQSSCLGKHQYKIRDSGLVFFPSLHLQVRHANNMDLELLRSYLGPAEQPNEEIIEPEDQKIEHSLIDMIFSPKSAESILLLGARNTFKTQLSLDFMSRGKWGCKREDDSQPECGLLLNLCDNTPDFERDRQWKCPWKKSRYSKEKIKCTQCEDLLIDHVNLFYQRPGCITAEEFFHYVVERIKGKGAKEEAKKLQRLVFWDLTQLDYRFPLLREEELLIPALMDKFKSETITSLFVGAGNAKYTRMASDMGDHVLFCWRSRYTYNDPITNKQLCKKHTQPDATDDDGRELSSLMLYVDRTTSVASKSGKAVYAIPIVEGGVQLHIPSNTTELKNYCIDPLSEKLSPEDQREVQKITALQGVGGAYETC